MLDTDLNIYQFLSGRPSDKTCVFARFYPPPPLAPTCMFHCFVTSIFPYYLLCVCRMRLIVKMLPYAVYIFFMFAVYSFNFSFSVVGK